MISAKERNKHVRAFSKLQAFDNIIRLVVFIIFSGWFVYYVASLTIIPFIPSGDDAIMHIAYCRFFNMSSYLSPGEYPNSIHLVCHMLTDRNVYSNIWFFKIFSFVISLIPIILILNEISKTDIIIAIPIAMSFMIYNSRYIQTLSDGSIFNIFSYNLYLLSIFLALQGMPLLSGLMTGLSLIHYYGIIYFATMFPYIFYDIFNYKMRKDFVIRYATGFIIGFSLSAQKWFFLLKSLLSVDKGVSGISPLPKWSLVDWLNYAFTPDRQGGFLIFICLMLSILILIVWFKSYSGASAASSLGLYILGILILPFLPAGITNLAAISPLVFRLYRFLPVTTIFLISILTKRIKRNRYVKLLGIFLLVVAFFGLIINQDIVFRVPRGLVRIDYKAFNELYSMSDELCLNGVIATAQTASYMSLICPNPLLINPPEVLNRMSPNDPMYKLQKEVLAELYNGTVHGYRWLILQLPINGQWYDPSVLAFVSHLSQNLNKMGTIKYVFENQGAQVYVIQLKN